LFAALPTGALGIDSAEPEEGMNWKQGHDLQCPECGKPDGVPVRDIERSVIQGGRAVARKVGKVYRCAHCAVEYCTGPQGVYVPKINMPRAIADRTQAQPTQRELEPRSLRDADQDWR
jgi:predicted RNA-binding Zn-ribbon protein involved in translation (DUF1610 family)